MIDAVKLSAKLHEIMRGEAAGAQAVLTLEERAEELLRRIQAEPDDEVSRRMIVNTLRAAAKEQP